MKPPAMDRQFDCRIGRQGRAWLLPVANSLRIVAKKKCAPGPLAARALMKRFPDVWRVICPGHQVSGFGAVAEHALFVPAIAWAAAERLPLAWSQAIQR